MESAIIDVVFNAAAYLAAFGLLAVILLAAGKLGIEVSQEWREKFRRTVRGFILTVEEKHLREGAEKKLGEVFKRMREKWPVLHMMGVLNPTVNDEIVSEEITRLAPLGIGKAGKQYLDRVKKTPPASGLTGPGSGEDSTTPANGGASGPAAAGTGG